MWRMYPRLGGRPLPHRPDFPVYGLDSSFHGRRWLDVWNQLGGNDSATPLANVNLGHGAPYHHGPVLVTITEAKLSQRRTGRSLWIGPTGVTDAALGALLGMVHVAFPADDAEVRPAAFWEEVNRLGELSNQLDGPEWSDATAVVDGSSVTFRLRVRNGAWAAAADLGHVAVGAYGRGLQLTEYPLVPAEGLDP